MPRKQKNNNGGRNDNNNNNIIIENNNNNIIIENNNNNIINENADNNDNNVIDENAENKQKKINLDNTIGGQLLKDLVNKLDDEDEKVEMTDEERREIKARLDKERKERMDDLKESRKEMRRINKLKREGKADPKKTLAGQLALSLFDAVEEDEKENSLEEDEKEEKKLPENEEEKKRKRQEYIKKRGEELKKQNISLKKAMKEAREGKKYELEDEADLIVRPDIEPKFRLTREDKAAVKAEAQALKKAGDAFNPDLANSVDSYREFLGDNTQSSGYVISHDAFKILDSLERLSNNLENIPVKNLADELMKPFVQIEKYKNDHAKTQNPAEAAVWSILDGINRNLVEYMNEATIAYDGLPEKYKEKKCSEFPVLNTLMYENLREKLNDELRYRKGNNLEEIPEPAKEVFPDQDAPYLPDGEPVSEAQAINTIIGKLKRLEQNQDYKSFFDYLCKVNIALSNPSYLNKEYDTDHFFEAVEDYIGKGENGQLDRSRMENFFRKYQEYQTENVISCHKKYQQNKNDEFWFSAEAAPLDSFGSVMQRLSTNYANEFCEGDNQEYNANMVKYQDEFFKNHPEHKEYYEKNLITMHDGKPEPLGIADFQKKALKTMSKEKEAYLRAKCTKEILEGVNIPGMFINNSYIDKLEELNNNIANNYVLSLTDKEQESLNAVVQMNKDVIKLGREMMKTAYNDPLTGPRKSFENLALAASEQMICLCSNLMQKPEWHNEAYNAPYKPIRESIRKMLGMMSAPETFTTLRANQMLESERKEAKDFKNIENRAESNVKTLQNIIDYKQLKTFWGPEQKSRTTLKKMIKACDIAKDAIESDPQKEKAVKLGCKKAIRKIIEDRFGFGKDISRMLGDRCYTVLFENDYRPERNVSSVDFVKSQIESLPKNKLANYDIDIRAESDINKDGGRELTEYKIKVNKNPVILQSTLDKLNYNGRSGKDFKEISPLLRDTDKLDMLSHMFNTKKRGIINLGNSGSYKNCKRLLKDVIEKRNRLIEMLGAYQESGFDAGRINTAELMQHSAALKEAVSTMLPEMQTYFRGSEKANLNDYWQDAGIARLSASKGIIDEFREKLPDITNEFAPKEDMRRDSINEDIALTNDNDIKKFTSAYEKAFRNQRENAGYDRHRMAAREASRNRKNVTL